MPRHDDARREGARYGVIATVDKAGAPPARAVRGLLHVAACDGARTEPARSAVGAGNLVHLGPEDEWNDQEGICSDRVRRAAPGRSLRGGVSLVPESEEPTKRVPSAAKWLRRIIVRNRGAGLRPVPLRSHECRPHRRPGTVVAPTILAGFRKASAWIGAPDGAALIASGPLRTMTGCPPLRSPRSHPANHGRLPGT